MSKNLGVLKKETVCNSGGNSMDTRTCVLKWRGSTYGSDRSVPDVSDAELYDRTAEPPVTQWSKWSISVAVLILHVEILHTPSVSDLCKKRECLLAGDTLFSALKGFLSQFLKYRKKWVKSQCLSLLSISVFWNQCIQLWVRWQAQDYSNLCYFLICIIWSSMCWFSMS